MEGAKLIPIAQIVASPFNPRRAGFTPADLAELTDSIKTKGVLYPISVRIDPHKPMLDTKGRELPVPYELIDGERRFRRLLALLIREGFFDEQQTATAAWKEMQRRGFAGISARVYEQLPKLTTQGFLTKEGKDGYRAVPGMKGSIRK